VKRRSGSGLERAVDTPFVVVRDRTTRREGDFAMRHRC